VSHLAETPAYSHRPLTQPCAQAVKPSRTILVVDDDCAIRMLVKALLETEGYAVLIAADAETALKLFDSSTVALLLTDVVMPDMNGPELADQLLPVGFARHSQAGKGKDEPADKDPVPHYD